MERGTYIVQNIKTSEVTNIIKQHDPRYEWQSGKQRMDQK